MADTGKNFILVLELSSSNLSYVCHFHVTMINLNKTSTSFLRRFTSLLVTSFGLFCQLKRKFLIIFVDRKFRLRRCWRKLAFSRSNLPFNLVYGFSQLLWIWPTRRLSIDEVKQRLSACLLIDNSRWVMQVIFTSFNDFSPKCYRSN